MFYYQTQAVAVFRSLLIEPALHRVLFALTPRYYILNAHAITPSGELCKEQHHTVLLTMRQGTFQWLFFSDPK